MTKFLFNKSLLSSSISQHAKLFVGAGLVAVLTLPASQVMAGGFQLSDHSVTGLGRNHAGYGVVGDDASAVQFNPAGLTLLNKKQVQFGAVINMV
ncbi:MAG: long-subunit fatty acid transport protein, partial [Marinobacter psychrophilus]